jgi:hypothetical protein
MKSLFYRLTITGTLLALTGCCCFLPDGDPPEGPIVNVVFGPETLTEERAVEAMIAKFSGAMIQANLSEQQFPVKFNCDAKFKKMSMRVFRNVGPMLNFTTRPAQDKESGPWLICVQKAQDKNTLWSIYCQRGTEKIFSTGVKVK